VRQITETGTGKTKLMTTIVSISSGGIAYLSDGSAWRVAPGHLKRVHGWQPGDPIAVQEQPNVIWGFKLTNGREGTEVSAIQSTISN